MKPIDKFFPLFPDMTGGDINDEGIRNWACTCRAHQDRRKSLSIGERKSGYVSVHCFAGCTREEILQSVGLTPEDCAPNRVREPKRTKYDGVTLEHLALIKRIPINTLRSFGLRDNKECKRVEIPYRDAEGNELYAKYRTGPKGGDSSYPNGTSGKLIPYGLWFLKTWAESGVRVVFLVEGESDCWAMWSRSFAAIGIPGADLTKCFDPQLINGFEKVVIWREPDKGGTTFYEDLRRSILHSDFQGKVLVHNATTENDGYKDPSDVAYFERDKFAEVIRGFADAAIECPPIGEDEPELKPGASGDYCPAGKFEFTEIGNSERIVHLHGNNLVYVSDWKSWAIWNGNIWVKNRDEVVQEKAIETVKSIYIESRNAKTEKAKEACFEWYKKSQTASNVSSMVKLARGKLSAVATDFNSKLLLLNVANGTIDLATGEFKNAAQSDYFTTTNTVPYLADAKCPTWERMLECMFPADKEKFGGNDELIEFIQRFCGYCLTGLTRDAIVPILWGSGSNGKSTFIKTVMEVMGTDYAMPGPPGMLIDQRGRGDQVHIQNSSLFGKRAIFMSETKEGDQLDASQMKSLSGGDFISARFHFGHYFMFKPTHKMLLATNHKPKITSMDKGTWRRIAMIPFTTKFWNPDEGETGPEHLKQDRGLDAKLLAEYPGILAWMVRGAIAYLADGLRRPQCVLDATEEYKNAEDAIGQFLEECTTRHGIRVAKDTLFEAYAKWCDNNGVPAKKKNDFGTVMKERGFGPPEGVNEVAKDGNGKSKRFWFGLDLRNDRDGLESQGDGRTADLDSLANGYTGYT